MSMPALIVTSSMLQEDNKNETKDMDCANDDVNNNNNNININNSSSSNEQAFQQVVLRSYDITNNKRLFTDEPIKSPKSPSKKSSKSKQSSDKLKLPQQPSFTMEYKFNLEPCLTFEYRRRHSLSLQDVRKILNCANTSQLLMLAMHYKVEATMGAIDDITSSSSAQLKIKIEGLILKEDVSINSNSDKIVLENDKHKPPLPLHFLTKEQLLNIRPASCDNINGDNNNNGTSNSNSSSGSGSSNIGFAAVKCFAKPYLWNDILLLPYGYYNGYLKMISVIPKHFHEQIYGMVKNEFQRPFEYLVGGMVYYGMNEWILFQTEEWHQQLSQERIKGFENSLYQGVKKK